MVLVRQEKPSANSKKMKELKEWHKDYTLDFIEKYNLSTYTVAWISWIKGMVTMAILLWIF